MLLNQVGTSSRDPIAIATALLRESINARIFPAAVCEVGDSAGVVWTEAFGTLTFDDDATATTGATLFDLASLTKPMATASVIQQLCADDVLNLQEPVSACFPEWHGSDRAETTIEDLLEHATGLPARLLEAPPTTRREFEHEICVIPLEYRRRTRALYSDVGFLLLGFLAADRGHALLDALFGAIWARVAAAVCGSEATNVLTFRVPRERRSLVAPTHALPEDLRQERLIGEVHDHYAAALGGVAGHAGLFGTAAGVGGLARALLRSARGDSAIPPPLSPPLVARATRKSHVPGSSRALGWDTALPTSSCGTKMSPAAFGHVGFTGTSVWIDPILDRYFVLLTNRACQGGTSEQMQTVRRAFHDAAATV